MKKIIFSILLLSIFALPATAKMNMDFIIKGGLLASPYLNFDGDIADVDVGFTVGGEGYIYVWENIGLGGGITYLFDTDISFLKYTN